MSEQITFSEAFEASEQSMSSFLKKEPLVARRRNRCLVTASMFLPPLRDNEVIDDMAIANGEEPIRLPSDEWDNLFLASSYLDNGKVVRLR